MTDITITATANFDINKFYLPTEIDSKYAKKDDRSAKSKQYTYFPKYTYYESDDSTSKVDLG